MPGFWKGPRENSSPSTFSLVLTPRQPRGVPCSQPWRLSPPVSGSRKVNVSGDLIGTVSLSAETWDMTVLALQVGKEV